MLIYWKYRVENWNFENFPLLDLIALESEKLTMNMKFEITISTAGKSNIEDTRNRLLWENLFLLSSISKGCLVL